MRIEVRETSSKNKLFFFFKFSLKQTEDHLAHGKLGPLRHRGSSWPNNQRIPALHMPKQHRLSVDANLQIPEELNSASKRDLLKKVLLLLFEHLLVSSMLVYEELQNIHLHDGSNSYVANL